MEVEVQCEDGSKLTLGKDEKAVLGRGCGFNTHDRTVSRRHVFFQLDHSDSDSEVANVRVSFQVIGRNPFWVYDGEALRLFRKFEKGHLQLGHRFCFSANTPLWYSFTLNNNQTHLNLDEINISEIDPVKEFGFLVMGHEFDHYPKGTIRNAKNWEWFLDEPKKRDSEDEEDFEKERRKMRGKRKMGEANEDDEWTGESEDDKDLVAANIRKGKLPSYSTRSKKSKGGNQDTKAGTNSKQKKAASVDETVEEEDDDETLGGFIVADEIDDREEENDEEEEEEFEDDDDEVED
ncbi:hypothetical protein CR513_43309 [Mucuna pruriens]|uniref:FHA domain-containing protein n=1 Tax=Mucuna pruriens TaxID=157652 RepID=A0A371FEF8_MUCPR|nr:hypothetical protein CR513_43309 [Mucuna pruriens]